MGPSCTREDVRVLLQEKDDRIVTLETRLEAYVARASTAHTRLMKTIDVLDALRSQHALEISAEEHSKMKLVHEVDRWRTVAKNLELEKDELKDVVEDLIEKVQVSNEWSSWPCSRMDITKHADNLNVEFPEQISPGTFNDGGTENHYNDDLLAYATSIIARLRTELGFERQCHRRSVEEANLRIEELEAKVAVREAELENRVTSLGDHDDQQEGPVDDLSRVFEKRKHNRELVEPKPLSDEECLHFLENNKARNRSLELEIRNIADRLEQARTAASSSSDSCKDLLLSTPQNGHNAMPRHSPRTRSASVDPNVLSRPSDAGNTALTPEPVPSSMMLSIAQLDNQIRTMTTQMDALVSERTTLIETGARQRRITDGINIDNFQDILRVEGECVRLQAEVDDLREQLHHARTSARDREDSLLREIAQLQVSFPRSPVSHPAHESHYLLSPQPLEESSSIEESMELASPLIPTSLPNTISAPPSSNPDLVLFPFSSSAVSSPIHNAPSTPPRTTSQSSDSQEIERVQAALDIARTRLTQKEEALSQLRAEMERLQLEVQAQTQEGHTS